MFVYLSMSTLDSYINHIPTQRVIELSKKYLKHMAIGYDCPKVKVHVQDGMEFMLQKKNSFDVVITDSSDPIGEDISKCTMSAHLYWSLQYTSSCKPCPWYH